MRHQIIRLGLTETLLDRALHTRQTGTELVLSQFTHRTDTAVTQMIDVIDLAATIAQLDQDLHHRHDVLIGQDR